MNEDRQAVKEILRSIKYLIEHFTKTSSTQIYDGIVKSSNSNGTWNVQYNGETHALKPYRITPSVNTMVKVVIPQGNQNLAYFM